MNISQQLLEKIIEFGTTLKEGLRSKDTQEIVPQIEDSVNDAISQLNNEGLGLLAMSCVLLLIKLAETKAVDEQDNIRTSVVTARAIIQGIDNANKKFNMNSFEIAMMLGFDYEFKPSSDAVNEELLKRRLEEMECVGEC